MKKVLVIYYTQTGQLRDIVRSVMAPVEKCPGIVVFYEELKPVPAFPFPWTSDQFFQAFPESTMAIPCKLEPFSYSPDNHYDLVIIAYQPWYLSPSIPFHSFLQSPEGHGLLKGKPVLTLIGCRNMWTQAQERVKAYIENAGGRPIGNIVLRDRTHNLLSIVTIVRWMFKGKKDRYLAIFPTAGVSDSDIRSAEKFGHIISESMQISGYGQLRKKLLANGAVRIFPSLVMLEKNGRRIFNLWAKFILKKGNYGDPKRIFRLRLFKYYLLAVLYIISPFATCVYSLLVLAGIFPAKKTKEYFSQI